jgi:hypothetical protein
MQIGKDEPSPLQFAFVPKVEQVADGLAGNPHVVEQLCFMVRNQFRDGFQFDDDATKDK